MNKKNKIINDADSKIVKKAISIRANQESHRIGTPMNVWQEMGIDRI